MGCRDFAVGISSQPLPNGRRFAGSTLTGVVRISATDANTRFGLDLVTLRPETVESLAKLPPTATNFGCATCEGAGAGRKQTVNGVKYKMFGGRHLGVGFGGAS